MIYINNVQENEQLFELIIPGKNGDIKRNYPKNYRVEITDSEKIVIETIETHLPLINSVLFNEITINGKVPTDALNAQQELSKIVFKKGGASGEGGENIPLIDDTTISEKTTYSSKKIEELISQNREDWDEEDW